MCCATCYWFLQYAEQLSSLITDSMLAGQHQSVQDRQRFLAKLMDCVQACLARLQTANEAPPTEQDMQRVLALISRWLQPQV
jgi:hypothetical protein